MSAKNSPASRSLKGGEPVPSEVIYVPEESAFGELEGGSTHSEERSAPQRIPSSTSRLRTAASIRSFDSDAFEDHEDLEAQHVHRRRVGNSGGLVVPEERTPERVAVVAKATKTEDPFDPHTRDKGESWADPLDSLGTYMIRGGAVLAGGSAWMYSQRASWARGQLGDINQAELKVPFGQANATEAYDAFGEARSRLGTSPSGYVSPEGVESTGMILGTTMMAGGVLLKTASKRIGPTATATGTSLRNLMGAGAHLIRSAGNALGSYAPGRGAGARRHSEEENEDGLP